MPNAKACVKGTLIDQTKVTLIDCISPAIPGHYGTEHGTYYAADIFPHFVVQGVHYINPDENAVRDILFEVDDADRLFNDSAAFGFLPDARLFIDEIVAANGLNRSLETGPEPQILYFNGKRNIFSADTTFGTVSASHYPSHSFGGPQGIRLSNRVFVSINFGNQIRFHEAIFRFARLFEYLGMLVGRPQNLRELNIRVGPSPEEAATLSVYWSMPPNRTRSDALKKPSSFDVLLDAVRQPREFSDVLVSWLNRSETWGDARARFFGCFAKQRRYDIDRLIGAANMFDVLPGAAVSADVSLTNELIEAKESARLTFSRLPVSPERDSILSALGRLGKSALKHKIRFRAQLLMDAAGEYFPGLLRVTDEAVNCRNYYVHGSEPTFDYNKHFYAVIFLTETLEFVFATSDLLQAGWDFKRWIKTGTVASHPFGRYRANYTLQLQALQALMPTR